MCCYLQADGQRLIVLQFRENYLLPTKAMVSNVLSRFGPLDIDQDIWMDRFKFLVYARFKYEEDARTAYGRLEQKAASLFNMSEVL